jgi:hypothetical protein
MYHNHWNRFFGFSWWFSFISHHSSFIMNRKIFVLHHRIDWFCKSSHFVTFQTSHHRSQVQNMKTFERCGMLFPPRMSSQISHLTLRYHPRENK